MLAAPADLDEGALRALLGHAWGIGVRAMTYRPVGWGSHHWEVERAAGARCFVTVDELENKRLTGGDSLDDGFARLRASLRSAVSLKDAGCDFVVAPVPARDGEPVVRLGGRFAVSVFPFVAGQSFAWGDGFPPARRLEVAGMVAAMHTAPSWTRRDALADEFAVPFRDEVEAACAGGDVIDCGPYTRLAADLFREHAAPLQAAFGKYDELVAAVRALPGREVLTHGELHPGNTMLTGDGGWLLIDWDTALVAPPERDLWDLDPGDGSVLDAYAAATGVTPSRQVLGLYRFGWDLKDIAYDLSRFMRPHAGSAEDDKSWRLLSELVLRVCG